MAKRIASNAQQPWQLFPRLCYGARLAITLKLGKFTSAERRWLKACGDYTETSQIAGLDLKRLAKQKSSRAGLENEILKFIQSEVFREYERMMKAKAVRGLERIEAEKVREYTQLELGVVAPLPTHRPPRVGMEMWREQR
jgi:hypothetical protein